MEHAGDPRTTRCFMQPPSSPRRRRIINFAGCNFTDDDRRHVLCLLHDRAARRRLPEILSHLLRRHALLYYPSLLPDVAAVAASLRRPAFASRLLLLSPEASLSLFNAAIKSISFSPSLEPFRLLSHLRSAGLRPDRQTFAPLLKSSSLLPSLHPGAALHAAALLAGFNSHAAVSIQLVELYTNFGRMSDACKVFDEMPHRETVVWNLMINGFCRNHDLESALRFFTQTTNRNAVTWNTMIAGLARTGRDSEAVRLLMEMWDSGGIEPDDATIVTVLPICARTGNSELGRKIHFYAEKKGLLSSAIHVGNSLIDMYSKCADVASARKVFDEIPRRNVVTWNAMINGLAINGHGAMGLKLFDEMWRRGAAPNASTFVSVLACCAHSGLEEQGREIFLAMAAEYGIKPRAEHYGCMVDLLGRVGKTKEALKMVEEMPMRPSPAVWGALLSACRNAGDGEVAEVAARELAELEPENSGNFVLLANLKAEAAKWDDAEKVWSVMRGMRVWKNTAQSSVTAHG
ncbi:Pentatricopeptide repeat-containing protein [Apostasia shenzhenica]|uniref:Pentatricopeptide repeat-containing protein n=1 Tax=Apostasia shenzhenica TaxID=1088818 RepID=A0A2I0AB56_9ASPA|nr:Pentatricopeptide repeat-containing protein [Apostasia shenzhenica]